ncbi:hypothetical protein, partial [Piscinibacter sp.]|uniref:hypothetical protein n=1 Tax=Piscinibacter sp. TaxID=1903157 RepID=UPI002D074EEB
MINTSMRGLERRLPEPDFAFPPSHAEGHPQASAEPPQPATAQPALDRLRRLPLPEHGRVVSPARDDPRGERRSIGSPIEIERVARQDDRSPGQGRTPIAQAVAGLPAAASTTPAAPTASATELGMVDLMLADPLNGELVAAWGGSAKLPDTDLARDQIARFGADRAGQMQQLAHATATVRSEYQRAVDAAAAKPPPPPAFNPLTHRFDAGELPPGWRVELLGVSEGTPNYRTSFSIDAYTAWYAQQDSLAGRAFAALYGEAKTTVEVGESYERSTTTIGGGLFTVHTGSGFGTDENGTSQAWQPGRLEASGAVVPISLSSGRELHDRSAVWFDPALGFVTARENIVQKQDWLDKAAPIIVTGVIMVATSGAGGLLSAAGGTGTLMGAVTTATGSSVLGAAALGAAGGALAATVNGAFSGHLSLKDIFRSALTGAVTGGVMQATGVNTLGLDQAGKVASYAQRAMAISGTSTLQGALTALAGGRFADGFKNGLTAGIAQGLAAEVMHGMRADIAARVKSGQLSAVDASALRTLTQATGSAIRALANPQDPGFAFAAEFVG